MSTTGIRAYFENTLAREIARMARVQGRSESSIIVEAVRVYLSARSEGALVAAGETQKRQLNRIEARIDQLFADQARIDKAIYSFVRLWLEHNPPLPEDYAESAAASASARLEHFSEYVRRTAAKTARSQRSALPSLSHEDAE